MSRLKKGDLVAVLSGKDRGKRGKILQVHGDRQKALVEQLNLLKHFERRSQANQAGGVIAREAPIPLARLAIVCPKCDRPARIGVRVEPDGSKRRICRRCEGVLGG